MVEFAVNRLSTGVTGSLTYESQIIDIVEDVNLNNNRIFVCGQGYDINSLQPLYNKKWNYNNGYFQANCAYTTGLSTTVLSSSTGYMFLYNGSVSTYAHTEAIANGVSNWNKFVGHTYHTTLDPQNNLPRTAMKLNGANNNSITTYLLPFSFNWITTATSISSLAVQYAGDDITKEKSVTYANFNTTGERIATGSPIENNMLYDDVNNDSLWSHCTAGGPGATTYNQQAISYTINYSGGYTVPTPVTTKVLTTAGYNYYWMGKDDYNNPYFAAVNTSTANDPIYVYYIDSKLKTSTAILSAQQPASPSTGTLLNCIPSNIRTANTSRKVFYSMHYDSLGALAPMRFVWDPTQIGSVTKTNCTMTYPSGTTFLSYAVKPVVPGGATTANYTQMTQYGKPYQFTYGSNNYVTFTWSDTGLMNANTNWQTRFVTPLQRTWITYQCGSGTGDDTLTYHSKLTFTNYADMARGWIPTANNTLAVAIPAGVKFYNFNGTSGWQPAGLYPTSGPVYSMGLDQTNRLWGIVGDKGCGSVHIITPQTPVNISLVLPNTNYIYTGSTISTNAALNAYDQNGVRYVANVTITIDGSTMTFANGATTGVFTTSDSADSNVALSITGGGINNITTSVNI